MAERIKPLKIKGRKKRLKLVPLAKIAIISLLPAILLVKKMVAKKTNNGNSNARICGTKPR
jgi:hypothetical protein